jgi:filamentous hemagglutinin family protein
MKWFGPKLRPGAGGSISLVGGDVRIIGGRVSATGAGRAGVASASSPGEIPLEEGGILPALFSTDTVFGPFTRLGTVEVNEGGAIRGEGGVRVTGGSLAVRGRGRVESVSDAGASGPIEILTAGAVHVAGEGAIESSGAVQAGEVRVEGASVVLQDLFARIGSSSETGDAQSVHVAASGAVEVAGGSIGSSSVEGSSGVVRVTGSAVAVRGGRIESQSGLGPADAVEVTAVAAVEVDGGTITSSGDTRGSNVRVAGASVAVRNTGSIQSSGSAFGDAAAVEVVAAGAVEIADDGFIESSSLDGPGGPVRVAGESVVVRSRGRIGSSFFSGNAGPVEVVAVQTVEVVEDGSIGSVVSFSPSTGTAGAVDVSAARVALRSGGRIVSRTFDAVSGAVNVTAEVVTLDGSNPEFPFTALFSLTDGPGAAADVSVTAARVELSGRAAIGTGRFGDGPAGEVDVTGVRELFDDSVPPPSLDGTVGPSVSLAGPAFSVDAAAGTIRGENLFHSFATLNLAPFEMLELDGPLEVRNVLVRVTGGTGSALDGRFRLIGGLVEANLFLLDARGLGFYPDARLEVGGALALSTADALRLGSDGVFFASGGAASMLSDAAPTGFVFTGPAPGELLVQRTELTAGDNRPCRLSRARSEFAREVRWGHPAAWECWR